jgi:hypothetical protein
MGRIKSALEIALEKTESVKSDKSGIEQFNAKQQGKKLANAFLAGEIDLSKELDKTPKDQQLSLKQGIFDILITQITLPLTQEDEKRIANAGKGLQLIIHNSRFNALYKQLTEILAQYLEESAQYEEAIRRQYAPKLRQKEEELSRRLGREVRIDPFQDPEFIAFYNQHINALKANYQADIDQVKEEVKRMFESS